MLAQSHISILNMILKCNVPEKHKIQHLLSTFAVSCKDPLPTVVMLAKTIHVALTENFEVIFHFTNLSELNEHCVCSEQSVMFVLTENKQSDRTGCCYSKIMHQISFFVSSYFNIRY